MEGKAGYEYLLAYKLTVPVYDLTVEFVNDKHTKEDGFNENLLKKRLEFKRGHQAYD